MLIHSNVLRFNENIVGTLANVLRIADKNVSLPDNDFSAGYSSPIIKAGIPLRPDVKRKLRSTAVGAFSWLESCNTFLKSCNNHPASPKDLCIIQSKSYGRHNNPLA